MEKKKKKPSLDLFLAKAKYEGLPKHSIFRRDFKALKKREVLVEKWGRELDDAIGPLMEARRKSIVFTPDQLEEICKKRKEITTKYRQSFYGSANPALPWEPPPKIGGFITPDGLVPCRYVTILECQQKVCVDNPVPLSVDWGDGDDVDGDFDWKRQYDRFTLSDSVYGDYYYNTSGYHRTSHTHEGSVNFRSGAQLVEKSFVKQIGVMFKQWSTGSNGAYVEGDTYWLPDLFGFWHKYEDWGKAKQYVSFQLLSRLPGTSTWSPHIPASSVEGKYHDLENRESRPPSYPAVYPPTRYVNLNEEFPAGTEFSLEIELRYWIRAFGYDGGARVNYSLEVQPYMNLQACTYQWPE